MYWPALQLEPEGMSPAAIAAQLGAALIVPFPVCVRNCFVELVLPARRASAGVAFTYRMSPSVVSGVCPSAIEPERFEKPGCKQFAFPLAAMPVAKLFTPHCDGVDASAVAVAAFPEVFALMVAARSTVVRLLTAESASEKFVVKFRLARCV